MALLALIAIALLRVAPRYVPPPFDETETPLSSVDQIRYVITSVDQPARPALREKLARLGAVEATEADGKGSAMFTYAPRNLEREDAALRLALCS